MHSFATWPLRSNTFIFPDKYSDRNPRPAKDPAHCTQISSKLTSLQKIQVNIVLVSHDQPSRIMHSLIMP